VILRTGIGSAGFFGRDGPDTRRAMAQHCQFCGKTPMSGHRVSHAHNVTNRKWHVNLKSIHAVVGGVRRKVSACTRCIRSGKITKANPRTKPAA
jgi:large subunit ribosomal protein L28